jgi:hypothetical protein
MVITAASTVDMVRGKFPQAVVETVDYRDEQTIVLQPEHLVEVCNYLKKNQHYEMLETIPNLERILMPADWTTYPLRKDYPLTGFDLPEPHWGGQVPYDVDPGVGNLYQQSLRTSGGRELNENRSRVNSNQEPGTSKTSEEAQ